VTSAVTPSGGAVGQSVSGFGLMKEVFQDNIQIQRESN
jgi:hypothetical protein